MLDDIRRYLSYFPSSAWSYPPALPPTSDRAAAPTPELLDIVSRDNRRIYDMRAVLDVVFDRPDWFEVQPKFGRAIICALAHLGGEPVAVVANQPKVLAGSIDADAADKAAHFITVADSFHLPIVFLADNPGMLPGQPVGAQRRAAQRRAHVRRADGGHHAQAARDAAQGVRVRLDGDVAARVRRSGRDVRVPGRDDGRDERGRAEPGHRTPTRMSRPSSARPNWRRRSGRPNTWGSTSSSIPARRADALLGALKRGIYSRQAAAEPVSRTVITP